MGKRFNPGRRQAIGMLASFAAAPMVMAGGGCGGSGRSRRQVVVYSSLDREFAAPILDEYQRVTGVSVLPKFDVESTKTVGLTNLIAAEADAGQPRCDLFWNNEILNTLRLARRGLLEAFRPDHAAEYPAAFHARDETWYGFAARARVLLVNTRLVPENERPHGVENLTDPKWKGKVAIAKPLFGTTATHATCLFASWGADKAKAYFQALKANGVRVVSGNKQVAQAVASGEVSVGLTDTDDAMGEVDAGSPVAIVYPDRDAGELGTLFIPNTLSVPKGAPGRAEAVALAGYLLGPAVETALALGLGAQIPLNPAVADTVRARVETPKTVTPMAVDWEKTVTLWDETASFLAAEFAG